MAHEHLVSVSFPQMLERPFEMDWSSLDPGAILEGAVLTRQVSQVKDVPIR